MTSQNSERGVVWVAYGYEFLIFAAHSARTLKQHSPKLGTCVVTNVPASKITHKGRPLFDHIQHVPSASVESRQSKLRVEELSPFRFTLYLDCDTQILRDVSPIFSLLTHRPLAIKFNPYPPALPAELTAFGERGRDSNDYGLTECNCGVMAFDRDHPAVREIYATWRRKHREMGIFRDQPAFAQALLETPSLAPLPIGAVWNATPTPETDKWLVDNHFEKIRILHYREPKSLKIVEEGMRDTYSNLSIDLRRDELSAELSEAVERADELFLSMRIRKKDIAARWDRIKNSLVFRVDKFGYRLTLNRRPPQKRPNAPT